MNDTDVETVPAFQLEKTRWTLNLSTEQPASFELQRDGKTHFIGTMEVLNNGQLIAVHDADWRFRHKPEKLEQWCQLHHSETLSINMNYYFADDALVIEYLARNTVPTRLDIRHTIKQVVDSPVEDSEQARSAKWQHQRDGLPSDFLSKTAKTDFFREAFSAKQWIVLENCEE
ncbi:TPA: hypothetical protein NG630_004743 [Vibrio parahaemolyticus]|nr:hypothetical protein [Vibrio parahaemolyticus]HCE3512418.1 hypothetical protein [Vibrio parahaemolyticus]